MGRRIFLEGFFCFLKKGGAEKRGRITNSDVEKCVQSRSFCVQNRAATRILVEPRLLFRLEIWETLNKKPKMSSLETYFIV